MTEHENQPLNGEESGGSTAPVKPQKKKAPKKPPARALPPWRVLLHNDDVNEMDRVISVVLQLTPLSKDDAIARTLEAHDTGVALLLGLSRIRRR